MEDSSEITIEFLRARLWTERSVSRCARQRADELEKRVADLEEQLKVVSMQRRKAEKATADVLAILESNDISDTSEAFDSGTEPETTRQSKFGSTFIKVEESTVKLRIRRNDSGDFSGSDHVFSPVSGRSLSWKGRKNTQSSPENNKQVFMKGRSSFKAVDSTSSKRRQGKSCRQIRQRDSRTMIDYHKINLQENNVAISSKVIPENMEDGPVRESSEIQVDKDLPDGPQVSCSENGRNKISELPFHGYETNEDMESTLEYQSQLVGGDEAMEKAQREWEEKFREKNSSTQDLCDLGNHSDVTEERDEIKTQPHHPSCTISFQVQEARIKVERVDISEELSETQPKTFSDNLSKSQSNSFAKELSETQPKSFPSPLHDDTRYLQDEKYQHRAASESAAHDFAFPMTKAKQNEGSPESNKHMPSLTPCHDLHQHASNENHSPAVFSSNSKSSSAKVEASGIQNKLYTLVPEKTTNGSDAVLSALLQAKVSLQQKMAALTSASVKVRSVPKSSEPSVSARQVKKDKMLPWVEARSVNNTIVPFDPATQAADKVQISVGCGGLFRVPQFSPEIPKLNVSSLENNYPVSAFGLHTNSQSSSTNYNLLGAQISKPYMDARLGFSSSTTSYTSSPYITDGCLVPHAKNVSRTSTKQLDHYSSSSLQPTSQYIHQPTISAHRNLITRVPSNEGSRTFFSSAGLPPTDNFSFHQ